MSTNKDLHNQISAGVAIALILLLLMVKTLRVWRLIVRGSDWQIILKSVLMLLVALHTD